MDKEKMKTNFSEKIDYDLVKKYVSTEDEVKIFDIDKETLEFLLKYNNIED